MCYVAEQVLESLAQSLPHRSAGSVAALLVQVCACCSRAPCQLCDVQQSHTLGLCAAWLRRRWRGELDAPLRL